MSHLICGHEATFLLCCSASRASRDGNFGHEQEQSSATFPLVHSYHRLVLHLPSMYSICWLLYLGFSFHRLFLSDPLQQFRILRESQSNKAARKPHTRLPWGGAYSPIARRHQDDS